MRIAFYAPLKSPDHPVPSGDRLMARQLRAALRAGGHDVALVSDLRAYCGDPDDRAAAQAIAAQAMSEQQRIAAGWPEAIPDVWVCYHPYYKSPDLIGPPLCRVFGVPYVTIEASYSARRNLGVWTDWQAAALDGVRQAAVNICLTARDRAGLQAAAPDATLADLSPFIDPEPFLHGPFPAAGPVRLITVAMMRAGDKLQSYAVLAQALARLAHLDWQLTVVGDGPAKADVQALFAGLGDRVIWAGLCEAGQVVALLGQSDLYLWPGVGEAYGLAYLEAQAAGLPVVAQAVAGVPEVVTAETGRLTAPGDIAQYAQAVAGLIGDAALRQQLGQAARARVLAQHSVAAATARLNRILLDVLGVRL